MNNWWLVFWVGALATYRITIIFTRDKIGRPLRSIPKLGSFFKCTYCVSVWIGFLVTFILSLAGLYAGPYVSILLSMAFSAITIMADRFFTSDYIT